MLLQQENWNRIENKGRPGEKDAILLGIQLFVSDNSPANKSVKRLRINTTSFLNDKRNKKVSVLGVHI